MWSPRIQKAIDVASVVHAAQERRGNPLPVIVHLVGVAAILAQVDAREDVVIAGYLHDVLEDVKAEIYSRDDMVRDFGETITAIVDGVTEDTYIRNWKERKQKYLEGLQSGSTESLLVSAADMTNNVFSLHREFEQMGPASDSLFNSSAEDRLWFYDERFKILSDRLGGHKILPILTEQWEPAKQATMALVQ